MPLEQSDERISVKVIGTSTCRLDIKNVQASDSGRITCEATNSQGRVSTFARLQAIADYKIYEVDNKLKQRVNSGSVCYHHCCYFAILGIENTQRESSNCNLSCLLKSTPIGNHGRLIATIHNAFA